MRIAVLEVEQPALSKSGRLLNFFLLSVENAWTAARRRQQSWVAAIPGPDEVTAGNGKGIDVTLAACFNLKKKDEPFGATNL
jgi:hypothetical protein